MSDRKPTLSERVEKLESDVATLSYLHAELTVNFTNLVGQLQVMMLKQVLAQPGAQEALITQALEKVRERTGLMVPPVQQGMRLPD